jgi:hypothetical protein
VSAAFRRRQNDFARIQVARIDIDSAPAVGGAPLALFDTWRFEFDFRERVRRDQRAERNKAPEKSEAHFSLVVVAERPGKILAGRFDGPEKRAEIAFDRRKKLFIAGEQCDKESLTGFASPGVPIY